MFSPLSLSLSFSFSQGILIESALERLRDDDVENDVSRETQNDWILEEQNDDENSTQRRKKKTTF